MPECRGRLVVGRGKGALGGIQQQLGPFHIAAYERYQRLGRQQLWAGPASRLVARVGSPD
jgi:hypothetical protein